MGQSSLAARTTVFFEKLQIDAPEGPPTVRQTQLEQFFMDRLGSLHLSTALTFFSDIMRKMSDGLSVNKCIHVVTQLSLFLACNPTFTAPFVRSGFLSALELDMQVRFVARCTSPAVPDTPPFDLREQAGLGVRIAGDIRSQKQCEQSCLP
jgi:hypothetical protein